MREPLRENFPTVDLRRLSRAEWGRIGGNPREEVLIMDKEKREKIALFRFGVISRLLWTKEDERQQEALLREITSTTWEIPFSGRTALGRSTVLEWLKKYRDSGERIETLAPQPRSDRGKARSLDPETEQILIGLKTELKGASLPVILRAARERKVLPPDFHASIQSLYRLFQRRGLNERSFISYCRSLTCSPSFSTRPPCSTGIFWMDWAQQKI
jgi:hypothetical protein